MRADARLALGASKLAQAAPAAWDEFVLAMEAYAQSVSDECVESPPATVLVAQGRAQQSRRTLDVLRNCRTIAAQVVSRAGK